MDQAVCNVLMTRVKVGEIVSLRHEVLRAGLSRKTAHFESDEAEHTHHFATILEDRAISCVSFVLNEYQHRAAWEMVGICTTTTMRGQGYGTRLLAHAENYFDGSVTYGHIGTLWCHARGPEVSFLEHCGWHKMSDKFYIPPYGFHHEMSKRLW